MIEPDRPVTEPARPASYLNAEGSLSETEPWRLELARLVTKPLEPRNFQPARPASDLLVKGSMSTSEPWRLEPAQLVQHASYHSVLGSERSQPMRSRPAQPRRTESGRYVTYPTWSHMELVRRMACKTCNLA